MEQQALFDIVDEAKLTIDDVAEILCVSTASVRNWIKTGYLEKAGKNEITKDSFIEFKTEIIGKEKLTQRANKSLKDTHDHDRLTDQIIKAINDKSRKIESIGDFYEENLSNSYKNMEGVYYTPPYIANRFFEFLPEDCSDLSFCDPCCGSGNFLVAALERGFKPENIYGFDIDPTAVRIAKRRVYDASGINDENIVCIDFLSNGFRKWESRFDVVFTNPPWGKKLPKSIRESISASLKTGISKDTSALFFFACLEVLKTGGYLGLLLQDAFFNIASYESARSTALNLKIKALIDFGKPFSGLLTKARGIVLQNECNRDENIVQCERQSWKSTRAQGSFKKNPKSIINISCSQEESKVIEHLYGIEHETLLGKARYGLGIVTGNNKKYCTPELKEGYMPVYKGSDIAENRLRAPSVFIPQDLTLYQQVAPKHIFLSKEKLIYKFISSDLVFYHDTDQVFILNSANMLVLNNGFPISHNQLCNILNSKIIRWLFRVLFETHKVLRSDIESLPIHANFFEAFSNFSEAAFLNYLSIEEVAGGTYRVKG